MAKDPLNNIKAQVQKSTVAEDAKNIELQGALAKFIAGQQTVQAESELNDYIAKLQVDHADKVDSIEDDREKLVEKYHDDFLAWAKVRVESADAITDDKAVTFDSQGALVKSTLHANPSRAATILDRKIAEIATIDAKEAVTKYNMLKTYFEGLQALRDRAKAILENGDKK